MTEYYQKCKNCNNIKNSIKANYCIDCGGEMLEAKPMEAPVYKVDAGPHGDLLFKIDEYDYAYQYATGYPIDEHGEGDTKEKENRITILDYDGVLYVPIGDL